MPALPAFRLLRTAVPRRPGRWGGRLLLFFGLALLLGALPPFTAQADSPGPRQREETVTTTVYQWWLLPWAASDTIACRLYIEHPDRPTPADVYRACGWDAYLEWVSTPPCPAVAQGEDPTTCPGYYLYFVDQAEVTRKITRVYPPPTVALYLEDCSPAFPHFRCSSPLTVHLVGQEPVPEAHITQITVSVQGQDQGTERCQGTDCFLTLAPQDNDETRFTLRFKATSSLGDASPSFTATVRLIPQEQGLLVDVLSPQWADVGGDQCAQAWEVLPEVQSLPPWLDSPADPSDLHTDVPYLYLGGRLIAHGIVDASSCTDGGLLPNGAASPCGIALAQEEVLAWQNRFDPEIWQAAQKVGVPARLLKRLLAVESQFWPGEFPQHFEVGFGQLSPHGIDTLLLWDPAVFQPLCAEMLGQWRCTYGYAHLDPHQRHLLHESIWAQANLACGNCPYGVDLDRSGEAIELFAHLLRAHCRQIGQTVHNITGRPPARVTHYLDLWRFTLANYNGPDCTYEALRRTWEAKEPLDWAHVREHFPPGCEGPLRYVEQVAP